MPFFLVIGWTPNFCRVVLIIILRGENFKIIQTTFDIPIMKLYQYFSIINISGTYVFEYIEFIEISNLMNFSDGTMMLNRHRGVSDDNGLITPL